MKFLFSRDERVASRILCHSCSDYRLHLHENIEIVRLISGTCRVKVSEREYTMESGDAVLIFPYEAHEFTDASADECVVCISLHPARLAFYGQTSIGLKAESSRIASDRLTDRAKTLFSLLTDSSSGAYRRETDSFLTYALYGELLESCRLISGFGYGDDAETVLKLCIQHYPDCTFHITDLARQCGHSVRSLSRFFSEQIGVSFPRFITALRLSHAVSLLTQSGVSVTEAALESGFGSVRSFHRAYKEEYGKAPGAPL